MNQQLSQLLDTLEQKLTIKELKQLFECLDSNPEMFITELYDILFHTEKERLVNEDGEPTDYVVRLADDASARIEFGEE